MLPRIFSSEATRLMMRSAFATDMSQNRITLSSSNVVSLLEHPARDIVSFPLPAAHAARHVLASMLDAAASEAQRTANATWPQRVNRLARVSLEMRRAANVTSRIACDLAIFRVCTSNLYRM